MKKLFILICAVIYFIPSNAQWTNRNVCVDGSGYPIKCWDLTIVNNLDCDLDFFWDYSCHQCGDILPADGPPPDYNLVQAHNTSTLYAYQYEWDCGDNVHVDCTCPCKLKFRVGNTSIAVTDPFVAEPWPVLSAWSGLGTVTYNTTLTCGPKTIQIVLTVGTGNSATMTFNYWP